MTENEFQHCGDPDLLLEHLMGKITRDQLAMYVRQCWHRITKYISVEHEMTVVDQFEALVRDLNDHDAAIYASEAALKAAGWAPDMRAEQRQQAELLRQIVHTAGLTSGK